MYLKLDVGSEKAKSVLKLAILQTIENSSEMPKNTSSSNPTPWYWVLGKDTFDW